MHFCAVHLDDPGGAPDEEVFLVVPGAAKTAIAVPLDALAQFLPLLERAAGGDELPRCPACGTGIPQRFVCPGTHSLPGDPG